VDTEPCPYCGEEIVWAVTQSGKLMPVNPEPHPAGSLKLFRNRAGRRAVTVVASKSAPDLHRPHLATCARYEAAKHARRVIA
jgi:hypothetical protein